mmetsp:Transcript_44644/g.97484  ORF Transcript_44644/g.97484 Transcript_44644/m.97484 type:complete len:109 (+) Transcript_44644:648-974(+)
MRLHYRRLLDDEAKDREVQHERKVVLRSELENANNQMIEHKEFLKQKEHEEELKIKQYLKEQDEVSEKMKLEEHARKKAKEEQQRKLLEQQEKQTNFVEKLDELRMKR